MAKQASRKLLIKKNAVTIAGVNSKGVAIAKSSIDVTTDDDNGYRTLLSEAGGKSLDISVSGVTTDAILRAQIMTEQTQLLTDITVEYPNGDTVSGDFFFTGYSEDGSSPDGAVEFSGTFESSGAWTYTPVV